MADEQTDNTPTQTRKIAHVKFTLPAPYGAGHQIDADEAAALNDAFGRRVSQMVGEAVAEVSTKVEATPTEDARIDWAEGWSLERAQREIIDSYLSEFSWSVDRKLDPVDAEMRRLARVAVEDAMAKSSVILDRAAKAAKVREVLQKNEAKLRKIAEKNVNTPLVEVNLAA